MAEPGTIVCYAPDKGASFSHGLRPPTPKRGWEAIVRFLAECADVQEPVSARLVAYRATEWDDAAAIQGCLDRTLKRFGAAETDVGGGRHMPSGEVVKGGYMEWKAPFTRYDEFKDYLIAGEPWPKSVVGPVALQTAFRFRWRDPDGSGPVVQQLTGHHTRDGSLWNELGVTLSRRSSVSPVFWYPFGAPDRRLIHLVQLTSSALPFKLSPRHFRLAVPRVDKSGYLFRRFDASKLVAA